MRVTTYVNAFATEHSTAADEVVSATPKGWKNMQALLLSTARLDIPKDI